MPANDEQGTDLNAPVHEADDLLLARLCTPRPPLAQYLLEPLGLGDWPKPRQKLATSFEAEVGSILPAQ